MNQLIERMIARLVRKGANPDQARAQIAELIAAHDGDNLAYALVYTGAATERTAYQFIDAQRAALQEA